MFADWLIGLSDGSRYMLAFIGGSICMVLTFLGSLPALLGTRISQKILDIGLGFSAGIMLVASFTSLILPGIEMGGVSRVIIGFILGAFAVYLANRYLPHEHLVKGFEGPESLRARVRVVWLLVMAIIIHNFPEGLAVGSAVAYDPREGIILAIASWYVDYCLDTISIRVVGQCSTKVPARSNSYLIIPFFYSLKHL
jgi:ZIP family zinc transporter